MNMMGGDCHVWPPYLQADDEPDHLQTVDVVGDGKDLTEAWTEVMYSPIIGAKGGSGIPSILLLTCQFRNFGILMISASRCSAIARLMLQRGTKRMTPAPGYPYLLRRDMGCLTYSP